MLVRGATPGVSTVYALQYGCRAGVRGEHFLGWDAASGERHDIAYYAWLVLSADRTILVDTGMDPAADPPLTGWSFRTSVPALLAGSGIAAAGVDTVVLTHLHYDHAGGVRSLPRARVFVQAAELAYWAGPAAKRNTREAWLSDRDDLGHVAALLDTGRAVALSGDHEVAPGVSAHLVGGHTAGMQIVAVRTASGPLVLASDALHFFENAETDRPGPILHSMPDVYAAFDRARELAAGGTVVPGHDTSVPTRLGIGQAPSLPVGVTRLA
ncbi:MBL fold metallo-hydrolase [Actinoplanes cyaneus]|uniref:MBL fold metallo-hydrolase n=1 Tax=Actinoplanes cyaneus TaxID=52696 RepID=A0A919IJW9_9ACTN|nr:N-acyl homoserine lactonase family protein [Actinoplanes cyaneus]MCW2141123.1 Glyoxylase, beta-lactamase superfamily II [Actinoplanes cyaneus]GID67184.1 MBL fold metallo-hydrolase [Actinoplanes cyaneus]